MWTSTSKRTVFAVLVGLSVLIVVFRWHTYREPAERDIAFYAVIGHELAQGRSLYSDLWDHKPPAIYATYALADRLVGYGHQSLFLLSIIAGITTLFALFLCGAKGDHPSIQAGLIAALLWSVLSGSLHLQGNQPNTEVFINLCLAWVWMIFLRRADSDLEWNDCLVLGLLIGLATLYKQIVLIVPCFMGVVFIALGRDASQRLRRAKVVFISGLIGGLLWVGVAVYFWLTKRWDIFIASVFTFNRYYALYHHFNAGHFWTNFWNNVNPVLLGLQLSKPTLGLLVGLLLICVLGLVEGCQTKRYRSWLFWLAYALGVHITISLPGRVYAHYFQLWLPPLIVGTAWTLQAIHDASPKIARWSRAVSFTVLSVILLAELPYYRLSAEEWSDRKYGDVFIGAERMGGFLGRLLRPNESFFEWGAEASLYYYSRISPPVGAFNFVAVKGGPLQPVLLPRVIADLERTQPELFLTLQMTLDNEDLPETLRQWVVAHYRQLIPPRSTKMILYARRESDFEHRMIAEGLFKLGDAGPLASRNSRHES